ncbi:MAG: GAP family protein [Solirubrobacterales bacterium]
METLLPRIIPIALGAAISPVVLIVNVLLLSSRTRPIARASWYAIGCAIVIVGFGIAGVTVIAGVSTAPRTVAAIIHLVVGTASAAFAIRALIRGPHPPPKAEDVAPEHQRDKPAWRFVFAGLGAMGVNMTTLVLYLSLDAEIVRSEVSTADDAIAIAIASVIILLPVWLPLGLTVFAPAVAHRVFGPLNDFLTRHKWAIEIIVPGGFAIYLLTLGTILLV